MATGTVSAVRLGMEVNSLTLSHFTEESVSQFLRRVADQVENIVVRQGGASPWFPNMDRDLPGSIRIPSDDDGEPFVFNLFTHKALTRCIVAADPANLLDQVTLMRHAIDSGDDLQRLVYLRIAARWNYSMRLQAETLLNYDPNARELPGDYDDADNPMISPGHQIARTHVVNDDEGLAVVDENGDRKAAGYLVPVSAGGRGGTASDDNDDSTPTIDL